MAGIPYPSLFAGTTTVSTAVNNNPVSGDTRWNQSTSSFEMFDGKAWTQVTQGWVRQETLAESVEHVVDKIGSYIEEDHADNATINDAYREWLTATERFRVVLTMAEK